MPFPDVIDAILVVHYDRIDLLVNTLRVPNNTERGLLNRFIIAYNVRDQIRHLSFPFPDQDTTMFVLVVFYR